MTDNVARLDGLVPARRVAQAEIQAGELLVEVETCADAAEPGNVIRLDRGTPADAHLRLVEFVAQPEIDLLARLG